MRSLTRDEARERSALLTVRSYQLDLDLSAADDLGVDEYPSTTVIRFDCSAPGAATFLDLKAEAVHEVVLNGRALDPTAVQGGRLALTDLSAQNDLKVVATMRYSRDGQGLHRAVDPADGRAYVWGHLFLDAAPRVYACFDQPDLKAPYDVRVSAPLSWTVLGNGIAVPEGPGRWHLRQEAPLATYFVTICAGEYASVTGEHDGIPLGVHVRQSLATQLAEQAPEILAITAAGMDYYHDLFGIRYPFGAYHQVFVPEFNAGAMENPGCVTLRDQMIHRGAATDQERLVRANTVLHELAHMWFGDLVTMTWWDDLWLNESFAEYMAHRSCVAATEFTSAWADFTIARKTWGYAAERSPSTHPVAGTEPVDAATALHNFDGISYAKGAMVLSQLVAYLGDGAFFAGLRRYLTEHSYGNASLADFLAAMAAMAAGKDLDEWAAAWLSTAGLDTLSVVAATDGSRTTSAGVVRAVPKARPADRPHAIEVAGYDDGREVVRLSVLVDTDEVELPELIGRAVPHVLVPDADSRSWATVRLSPRTLQALPRDLAAIPSATTRAVVWVALLDGVVDAVIDPRTVLAIAETAWAGERDPNLVEGVGSRVLGPILRRFLPPSEVPGRRARCAQAAADLRSRAHPGSSAYLIATRLLAGWSDDLAWLGGIADGDTQIEPLADETDLRWIAIATLARRGAADATRIEAMRAIDDTVPGNLAALEALAMVPTTAAKEWAWDQIVGAHGRSNYELNALATGFWRADDEDLVRPYVARYFTDIPALTGRLGEDALARVAALAFPGVVEQPTADLAQAALTREDLGAAVRREFVDGLARLEHALASRRRFG